MHRPPHFGSNSKRIMPLQYLTPRERPLITYPSSYHQTNQSHHYRSRGKQHAHVNISNESISFRNSEKPKFRESDPLNELKLKLTNLKLEVNNVISSQSRSKERNTSHTKNQYPSYRSSSVEQFSPILSLSINNKKNSTQSINHQRIKILEFDLQNLKKQKQIWKNRYATKKVDAERQILDLSRKLISTSQKLATVESSFQEYKMEVDHEMQEIRRSLHQRNNHIDVDHGLDDWKRMLEENNLLKERVENLVNLNEQCNETMLMLEERINALTSQNIMFKSHKTVQFSKFSQIRVESNIFDLSKSKINVDQEKQQMSKNLLELQGYLNFYKSQEGFLKDKIMLLEGLLADQRLDKTNLQKEFEKARFLFISKQKQIDQLSHQLESMNKNTQQLLRLKTILESQLSQLRCQPQESIIKMITSQISIKQEVKISSLESEQIKVIKQEYQAHIMKLEEQIKTLRDTQTSLSQLSSLKNDNLQVSEPLLQKDDQIQNLSTKISLIRTQLKNSKSESEMQKLKYLSQKKQMSVSFQITIQALKSQLEILKKNIGSLNQRNRILIQDNKKKDQFIQRWIVARAKTDHEKITIQTFFEKFRQQFYQKYETEEMLLGQETQNNVEY